MSVASRQYRLRGLARGLAALMVTGASGPLAAQPLPAAPPAPGAPAIAPAPAVPPTSGPANVLIFTLGRDEGVSASPDLGTEIAGDIANRLSGHGSLQVNLIRSGSPLIQRAIREGRLKAEDLQGAVSADTVTRVSQELGLDPTLPYLAVSGTVADYKLDPTAGHVDVTVSLTVLEPNNHSRPVLASGSSVTAPNTAEDVLASQAARDVADKAAAGIAPGAAAPATLPSTTSPGTAPGTSTAPAIPVVRKPHRHHSGLPVILGIGLVIGLIVGLSGGGHSGGSSGTGGTPPPPPF